MTNLDYSYFELLNTAAMKATTIGPDGLFVFENDNYTVKLLKDEAKKYNIPFDDTYGNNEFKIEVTDIGIYSNFEMFLSQFPLQIDTTHIKKRYYCYYSKELCKLNILDCSDFVNPKSFYFSAKDDLNNNINHLMSNVFYWQKIYEKLITCVCDETRTDKSFCINSYEKGRCHFSYNQYNEQFNEYDLKSTCDNLVSIIQETSQYPMLLKNRCVERVNQKNGSDLKTLISELTKICEKVKTDFEIFIAKIDFDSYIQKYNDKVNDTFSQVRGILEKMMSNVFTLPLSYAGAIFTFDKLSDSSYVSFVFIAMIIYTVLSCVFLSLELFETKLIKKRFNDTLNDYTNGSIFLMQKASPDKNQIEHRIYVIRILGIFMITVFIGLLIYFWLRLS